MASSGGAAAQQITIVNSEPRIRRYGLQSVPERFAKQPPHQRECRLQSIPLKPGANLVDADAWDRLKKNDSRISKDLGDGKIAELRTPIHKLPEPDAIRIVKLTIERPILLGAQAKETRETVKRALTKQLKEIARTAHTKKADDQ